MGSKPEKHLSLVEKPDEGEHDGNSHEGQNEVAPGAEGRLDHPESLRLEG
jgi:hypothetical protein